MIVHADDLDLVFQAGLLLQGLVDEDPALGGRTRGLRFGRGFDLRAGLHELRVQAVVDLLGDRIFKVAVLTGGTNTETLSIFNGGMRVVAIGARDAGRVHAAQELAVVQGTGRDLVRRSQPCGHDRRAGVHVGLVQSLRNADLLLRPADVLAHGLPRRAGDDLALADLHVDAVQGLNLAVEGGNVFELQHLRFPQVGFDHFGIVADLFRCAVGQGRALVDHDDMVGNAHDQFHVMFDEQNGNIFIFTNP